jgi:pre-rRNA-processing protein IPI1
MEVIPQVVIEGWVEGSIGHGRRVLEGYLGVLNAGTAFNENDGMWAFTAINEFLDIFLGGAVKATSTASVMLSPSVRLSHR